jgi:glycosyltransferase involved in cell wall biosynthesis
LIPSHFEALLVRWAPADKEMIMDLVTVIIPTFNSERFVSDAIDSVIAQNYPKIEIIVVDDGSTDRTVKVVQQRLQGASLNWRIIALGNNMGPSAARNAGLRAASGLWIQFLDSDDLLMPGKINRQMAICARAPSNVVAVYSPWSWGFFENQQIEWIGTPTIPSIAGKAPIMCLAGQCRPLLAAGLTRRSALNEIGGFDEGLRFWECEEINVRIATIGSFWPALSDEPEYFWRLHQDRIYIGGTEARYNSTDVALGWIKQVLKVAGGRSIDRLGLTEQDRNFLLQDCTLWGRLLYSQNRQAFRDYLNLARMLDPNLKPAYPQYISALSRWLDYESAEAVAQAARMPITWLNSATYRLKLRRRPPIMELR